MNNRINSTELSGEKMQDVLLTGEIRDFIERTPGYENLRGTDGILAALKKSRILGHLKKCPLFKGIVPDTLIRLALESEDVQFKQGEVILAADNPQKNGLYFNNNETDIELAFKAMNSGESHPFTKKPGGYIGEFASTGFDPSGTVIANESGTLTKLSPEKLESILNDIAFIQYYWNILRGSQYQQAADEELNGLRDAAPRTREGLKDLSEIFLNVPKGYKEFDANLGEEIPPKEGHLTVITGGEAFVQSIAKTPVEKEKKMAILKAPQVIHEMQITRGKPTARVIAKTKVKYHYIPMINETRTAHEHKEFLKQILQIVARRIRESAQNIETARGRTRYKIERVLGS